MEMTLDSAVLSLLLLTVVLLLLMLRKSSSASGLVPELRHRADALEQETRRLQHLLDEERALRIAAQTRLEAEQARLQEQRQLLAEAHTKLGDTFRSLSADALRQNRTEFLGQADRRLHGLEELLKTYQLRLDEVEKTRSEAYGGLRQHLEGLTQANDALQREAHSLSVALRSPTVRGRWGEVTLRRVVELAGMSQHCDFSEQQTTSTEEGRLRPDMIVHLPNQRIIVVDSKVPLDAYLSATSATEEGAHQQLLAQHAQAVRDRMRELGQKGYAGHLETSPDFVVLFLPGESFFSAALEHDRSLIEDGMANGVVLATPTTLIALLRAVAYGWQQQALADNARRIAQAGRDLFQRLRVFAEHMGSLGKSLRSAVDTYNRAIGSYESRLIPGARRLAELGAGDGTTLPDATSVQTTTRALPEREESDEDL